MNTSHATRPMGIVSPKQAPGPDHAIGTMIHAGSMDGMSRPMRYTPDGITHPTTTAPSNAIDLWSGVRVGVHGMLSQGFGIFPIGAGAPGAVPTFQEGGI